MNFWNWIYNAAANIRSPDLIPAALQSATVRRLTDRQIQKLIEQLYRNVDQQKTLNAVKQQHERAIPFLLHALLDERTFELKYKYVQHSLDPKSPFEAICRLLIEHPPAEAVTELARYAAHPDSHFRTLAGGLLGTIGTDQAIPSVLQLLDDDDIYVQSRTVGGIFRAFGRDQCSERFLGAVFESLKAIAKSDKPIVRGDAPKLMLSIDPKRAKAHLLSSEYLSDDNRQLHNIIRAFNELQIPISQDKLRLLIEILEHQHNVRPHSVAFSTLLIALSINPDEQTESFLKRYVASDIRSVSKAAEKGLNQLQHVRSPSEFVANRIQSVGWTKLTETQKNYASAMTYSTEVQNGGHAQYFANVSSESFSQLRTALHAITADRVIQILDAAESFFGDNGPNLDRQNRIKQLASLSQTDRESIFEVDRQFYDINPGLSNQVLAYVRKNVSHFQTDEFSNG